MKININKYLSNIKPKNGLFYTIAIDGRGGAGKSELLNYLSDVLHDFSFINGDDYFEPVENQIAWGAYNDERFIKDVIKPIRSTNKINFRPYNWQNGPPYLENQINIKRGICIERCYSFGFNVDWDVMIWVETPKDICRERGMARESMPKERVQQVWETVWQPLETKYIEATNPLEVANIVLDGTKPFADQID